MINFAPQPVGLPWPTIEWSTSAPAPDVDVEAATAALRAIRETPVDDGVALATLVIHGGRIVFEQYGADTDLNTTLLSWSMAKSITHALFGLLVGDGLIDIDDPAPVLEFAGTDKASITTRDLLAMKSGLEFVEDYEDEAVSHILAMFRAPDGDYAHYTASQRLEHEPGTVWNYSSGTTNILARIAGELIGGGEQGMRTFLHDRLFGLLGMASAEPKFDGAGTFVGSSFVYATARDFARFGYLYLRGGVWGDRQLLPLGWADYGRTEVAVDPDPPHFGYGAHWWIRRDQPGSIAAHGYDGQYIIVVPARDLVVVQLSRVPTATRPALLAKLDLLVNAFASSS